VDASAARWKHVDLWLTLSNVCAGTPRDAPTDGHHHSDVVATSSSTADAAAAAAASH